MLMTGIGSKFKVFGQTFTAIQVALSVQLFLKSVSLGHSDAGVFKIHHRKIVRYMK
jgi:hypothetical protein